MSDELYSKFDEALRAESMTAVHADRDRAAAAAVSSVRTRRRRRAAVASAVALVAVPALAFGAYALTSVEDAEPMVTPSPSPSATQSPTPSPAPSQVTPTPETTIEAAPETWDEVPEADRPAYRTDLHADLPRARAMEDWIWQYVDDGWTLETHAVPGAMMDHFAQALYLRAPDEDLLHLYDLRRDTTVEVGSVDWGLRIAWLERHGGGEAFDTVQMNLFDGTLTADWAGAAAPDLLRFGDYEQEDPYIVMSVRKHGNSPAGDEVWMWISSYGPFYPAMLRDERGQFIANPATAWLESRFDEGWGNSTGQPAAEAWVAEDLSFAVYTVLEAEWSDTLNDWERGDTRWLWHDISAGTITEVEPQLPEGQACWAFEDVTAIGLAYMVGSRVVAACDQGTYLIDPTGERAPEPYAG